MKKEIDKDRLAVVEDRRKHFAIEIGKSSTDPQGKWGGGIELSITHNGSQWQSLGLSLGELKQLAAKIADYLAKEVPG